MAATAKGGNAQDIGSSAAPPAYGQQHGIPYQQPSAYALPAPAAAHAPGTYGAAAAGYGSTNQQPAYGSANAGYGTARPPVAAAPTPAPYAAPAYNAAPAPAYNTAPPAYHPAPAQHNPAPYGAAPVNPYAPAASSAYGSARPVVSDHSTGNIVPISAINPYSNKWTIKARVTTKSEKRHWSNAKGEGTLFSIDLLDSAGGEIRCTMFKEACEKFFPVLEEGKVYTFSGGLVKVANNRQFSTIKNQYELTFNVTSEIHAVNDDHNIKVQHYNFIKIDALNNVEVNSLIDIIGVVRYASDVSELTSKAGKPLQKRDLTLMDDTNCEVRLTLWGEKATAPYDWLSQPVVAFRNVKVGDYGGRSLGATQSTSVVFNPPLPEGVALFNWKSQYNGALPPANSLSGGGAGFGAIEPLEKRKVISSIRDENLGHGEKPDFISFKATIIYIKHDTDPWYCACPTPGCNKKVTEGMGGQWHCEKCSKSFPECQRRYILSLTMADPSGSNWFTVFNDQAEVMLGVKAQDLYNFRTADNNEQAYEKVFADALFKTYICKARVKVEQVNDEQRVKSALNRLDEVDLVSECQQTLDAIRKYQ